MTQNNEKVSDGVLDPLTKYLCETSQVFISYFNAELNYIKTDIDSLSEKAMTILSAINKEAETSRNIANESISKTYLETSVEMAGDLKKVQDDVDSIMTEALSSHEQPNLTVSQGERAQNENVSLRRQSGLWSKHLESLSTLEGLVCTPMFNAITSLSHDDIVMHYINNAISVLDKIKETYFPLAGEKEPNINIEYSAEQVSQDLNKFYQLYSMVSERDVFKKFWNQTNIKFKSSKKSA